MSEMRKCNTTVSIKYAQIQQMFVVLNRVLLLKKHHILLCCKILFVLYFYGIVVNFVGIRFLCISLSFSYIIIYEVLYTIDVERFVGINIRGFSLIEVFVEYFCVALAISAQYLVLLQRDAYIHGKAFAVLLKTVNNVKV